MAGCKDKAARPAAEESAELGSGSGSGSAAPCDEAELRKHVEGALAAMNTYIAALEKRTASWALDCEAASADLRALEPEVDTLLKAMRRFTTWGVEAGEICVDRAAAFVAGHPMWKDIEKRGPGLDAKVQPLLERCNDHPGFLEAVSKGLRSYKKKW